MKIKGDYIEISLTLGKLVSHLGACLEEHLSNSIHVLLSASKNGGTNLKFDYSAVTRVHNITCAHNSMRHSCVA